MAQGDKNHVLACLKLPLLLFWEGVSFLCYIGVPGKLRGRVGMKEMLLYGEPVRL